MRGRWFLKLLIMGFGITLAFIVIELVVLRGIYRYHGSAELASVLVHDDLIGWKFKPGSTGIHSQIDFSVSYEINSKGLRDREFSYEKSPGTYRILVLGDSMTEGFGLPLEETYVKQSELFLSKNAAPGVEVINAGVRGYSTDQQFIYLKQEGIKYNPDLVVLAFIEGDQNNLSTVGFMGSKKYYKPFFSLNGSALKLEGIPVPQADTLNVDEDSLEPVKGILRRFALYGWVREQIYRSDLRSIFQEFRIMKKTETISVEGATQGASAYGEEAWLVERQILKEMKLVVEEQGGELMIFLMKGDVSYSETLSSLSKALDIAFLDLPRDVRFVQAGKGNPLTFRYDGHYNALGHRVAAETLSGFMFERFMPNH